MGWVLILVRIAGIFAGVVTLLRLATTEKLVTYEPLFQQWLEVLTEFVDYAFLIKFIGPGLLLAIDYFQSLGIPVPDLQDEWRPAFVLSLLVLGAAARNVPTGLFVVVAPCPGNTRVSSGSEYRCARIAASSWLKSEPGKSVRPIEPANSASPTIATRDGS